MKNNGNVIIIGSGPAGVSAALYTIRAGIETTVISDGEGSLKKAEKIENYYGFSDPITGDELEASAIKGAKRLGVKFVNDEVVGLKYVDSHVVQTIKNEYPADSVIIATGSTRKVPKILGLIEHEGKGVSYCAVCDAFFYRNKNVGVLGFGEYAVHEAMELLPVVNSVTILTNGEKLTAKVSDDIQINTKKILSINGEDRLSSVSFEGSEELQFDGFFVAYGTAGSLELARKIGAITEGNNILVDNSMQTNIPGIFAAGDCIGGIFQISKAVYEGSKAGMEAIKFIRNLHK